MKIKVGRKHSGKQGVGASHWWEKENEAEGRGVLGGKCPQFDLLPWYLCTVLQ